MKRSNQFFLFVLAFLLAAGLFYGFTQTCLSEQADGIACLEPLRPYITPILLSFERFRVFPFEYYQPVFGSVLGLLLLGSAVSLLLGKRRLALLLFLPVLPTAAEGAILLHRVTLGVSLHFVGFFFLCLVFLKFPKADTEPPRSPQWRLAELAGFFVFVSFLTVLRFYLLNRVPSGWDTEVCPDRHHFFRSLPDLMHHEAGWSPQTSLGLFWLGMNFLLGNLDEPDNYYLYTRLLGTGLSILKFTLMFCCVRSLFGVFPAFLSMALLGFGPPEDWWSREPNYHHIPGIMAILILWVSARAVESRRWRDFILLTILTGLSRFLYPSGLFLAFIPLTYFSLLTLFKWSEWKKHLLKVSFLSLGIAFWYLWRSIGRWNQYGTWEVLPPFEVPSHSALPPGLFDKLYVIFIRNGVDLLTALFVHQVHSTHWTVALTIDPMRSVTSIAVVLGVIALARIFMGKSGQIGLLLLVCIAWTVMPGLTTEIADRRIGASFAILIALVSREAGYLAELCRENGGRFVSWLIKLLLPVSTALCLAWIGANLRFRTTEGEPHQVTRGQLFRESLQDGALAVYLTGENICESFYGVYRELKKRDCRTAWEQPEYEGKFNIQKAIENPGLNTGSWVYTMTDLSSCVGRLPQKWNRVVYMMNESQDTPKQLEQLRARYPNGVYQEKEKRQSEAVHYKIFTYTVDFPQGTPAAEALAEKGGSAGQGGQPN
jgi:hypothetical protein